MEIGIVGKPNVGKSTFFNALTLQNVPTAPFPFTTVKPNRGVAGVRSPCPHREKGVSCSPGNAACIEGTRWVPVSLVDVPGLVPGAHLGRGLGHQFLDDLRAAEAFIQVVDASGSTSSEGVAAELGSIDPSEEVQWLREELVEWVADILGRDFDRQSRGVELEGKKVEEFVLSRLTGLSMHPGAVATALRTTTLDLHHPSRWSKEERRKLASALLIESKPRLVAGNKCDKTPHAAMDALKTGITPTPLVPTASDAELSLRKAVRAGLVEYHPGDSGFLVPDPGRLTEAQLRALEEIRAVLASWGSTGVQAALERTVFDLLTMIVVYPVEDETHWTDSKGRVLPDAFLIPAQTPVRSVAYRVHTELGENFIRAIDARTHRTLGADHPLEPNAVVRIVARR